MIHIVYQKRISDKKRYIFIKFTSEINAALFDNSDNQHFQIDHYIRECGYVILIWKNMAMKVSFHGKYGDSLYLT